MIVGEYLSGPGLIEAPGPDLVLVLTCTRRGVGFAHVHRRTQTPELGPNLVPDWVQTFAEGAPRSVELDQNRTRLNKLLSSNVSIIF